MNSPLCNNLVKALVLEGQRSREKYAVGPANPPCPLLPTLYCCLTTSFQNPPTPPQLICHLHSSPQDNSNEPKDSTSKVCTHSACSLHCLFPAADQKSFQMSFLHLMFLYLHFLKSTVWIDSHVNISNLLVVKTKSSS